MNIRIEAVLAIALAFGIFVTLSAAIAVFHLTVAAVAVYRLTGNYLWNIGGYEFCLSWAICCWVIAMHHYAYPRTDQWGQRSRAFWRTS